MGSCGHVAPLGRNLSVVFVWNVVVALAEDAASFDSKTINISINLILSFVERRAQTRALARVVWSDLICLIILKHIG